MSLTEVVIKVSIAPEDVEQFDNLGYEVTQRHMEIAAELMEERFNENFGDDLFHALLAAKQYAADEARA